jgi:hypothetical protein
MAGVNCAFCVDNLMPGPHDPGRVYMRGAVSRSQKRKSVQVMSNPEALDVRATMANWFSGRMGDPGGRRIRRKGRVRTTNDGLLTPKQAAADIGISVKTLTGHANDGEIRYINVGRGKKKTRRMYDPNDIKEFKERRARREVPQCQSTATRKARSTTTISDSKVIAFTALQNARTNVTQNPSKLPSATGRNSKPR